MIPLSCGSSTLWMALLNYIHGLPCFARSIALEIEGELAVGLIYEPLMENIYSAIKGSGAFKNGKRIHVSRSDTLNTSLVATGFHSG